MKWFRRNKRTGSRLALFALALQFVLSFGHFHIDGAHAAFSGEAGTDLSLAQGLKAAEPLQAGHQDDGKTTNVPCTICAVMSAAKQIVFAPPTLLLFPDAVALRLPPVTASVACLGTPWPAFRSRAPPVS